MTNRPASRNADLTGRTHSLQTALRILIALALAMISLPFLSTSASAAAVNGFEIDGNRLGTDDWAGRTGTAGYSTVNDQISVSNKDDDVFKGSHEAHLPSSWGGAMGSPSTGDDIGLTETFSTVDTTGNVFFYLGFARKTAGVGAFVVELNQKPNVAVPNRQEPTLNFTVPDRTVGDVRITFSQGNGNGSLFPVGAAKWNATTQAWDSVALDAGDYDGQASSDDLFAELGINLTAAGLRPPCGSAFTQVNVRSRASDSDSALHDYVAPLLIGVSAPCKSIRVEKYDDTTGLALPGASFRLYKDDGDGAFDFGATQTGQTADAAVGGVVAADDGGTANTATWSDLPWGLYFVQETVLPAGYNVDTGLNSERVKQQLVGSANDTEVVAFSNPQTKAQIRVEKYDASTDAALPGAKFKLYKDDGDNTFEPTGVDSDTLIGAEVAADEDFGTNVDNTYTWTTPLAYGRYFVEESGVPAGYDADAEPGTVNGVRTIVLAPVDGGKTMPVRFYNPPEGTQPPELTSTITVTKTDVDTNQQVDGATFVLSSGGVVVSTLPAHTAGTGVYTWSGLLTGTYTVTEAVPPAGYLAPNADSLPADDVESVTIDDTNDGETFSVGFQNQKRAIIPPPPDPPIITVVGTDIEVTKRDSTTNEPVDTATFQLWEDADANGTLEATDDKISPAKNTVNGVVSWVNLLKGTYFVEETVAPKGYDLPANTVMTIVVDGIAGGTLSRSFYDPQRRSTIELVKQDNDTNQVLAGAVFQAYLDVNEDGTYDAGDTAIGDPQTSDANGLVSWSGLKFGHYVIHEVTAPVDYDLAADQSVVLDRDNAGGTVQLTFLDVSQGAIAITKVAFEKNAAGDWVPSDGEVEFGDLVKYELTADAYGAKMYRDVWVVDYIPGFDPADTKSTTKASYVNGSATCGRPVTCPVTFEADEQELAWSLGDMQGEDQTLEFVVRMPLVLVAPVYDENGQLIETVVNIAELSWQEDAPQSTQRLAAAYGNRSIRSNEVITTIVERPQVLDTPPALRPETVKRPGALLPDTGAPTHSALFGTVGSLSLLLGAWLMLVGRGRGHLPQR